MHILQICAVLLSFVSLLLLLISLGSNNWVELIGSNFGLWNLCNVLGCFKLSSGSSSFEATRAFMLLGMIAGAVSFFGLCFTFYKSRLGSISLAKVSAIVSFAAGTCALIAMSVFTAATTVNGTSSWYGWSFGLGWASFPFFLLTGGVAFALQSVTTE